MNDSKDSEIVADQDCEEDQRCVQTNRRKFLGLSAITLALVSAGVSAVAWRGLSRRQQLRYLRERVLELAREKELKESDGGSSKIRLPDQADVREYRAYLSNLNLPYLSADEIIAPQYKYREGVCSGVPPKDLWGNMKQTSRLANEIRQRLGLPLHTVVSSYRSPRYNSCCPGASKRSQHLKNRALDLIYACPPKAAFDMAVQLREEGYFKGGIGLYASFIHIDTRGRNATWGG